MCPKFNITVKLKKTFAQILLIVFVRTMTKIMIFLSKENSLLEKRLSDKLATFLERSNLVLTFEFEPESRRPIGFTAMKFDLYHPLMLAPLWTGLRMSF